MDPYIKDSESITRFLVADKNKHCNLARKEIKAGAFFPSFRMPELSVYRIQDIENEQIWEIADEFVAPNLKGFKGHFEARADILVENVRKNKLDVISEPTPHPRHADIINWPKAPTEPSNLEQRSEARELWQAIAQNLLLDAKFVDRA